MFRNAENYSSLARDSLITQKSDLPLFPSTLDAELHENVSALPLLMKRYLDHLGLSAVQRAWVEEQITKGLSSSESQSFPPFVSLQQALADLSGGDELQTRLAMALPATGSVESRPDLWLRQQQTPKIHRVSMASKPFLRTPQAALREWFRSQPVARRTVPTGRLRWLAKLITIGSVVIMGSLAVPAFAHASDYASLVTQHQTREIAHISRNSAGLSVKNFRIGPLIRLSAMDWSNGYLSRSSLNPARGGMSVS